MRLDSLFDVVLGNKLDLNKLTRLPPTSGGVNFVARSRENNGVTATVAPIPGVTPFEPRKISVALGGTSVLASFVQLNPFYTAQNVAVLSPQVQLRDGELVYVCLCIEHNRFRYSAFGREANRTIDSLEIPDRSDFPEWTNRTVELDTEVTPRNSRRLLPLDTSNWKPFKIVNLFRPERGGSERRVRLDTGRTPYIGASDRNNGIVGYVQRDPDHPANTLTLPANGEGGVGAAFYQPTPYCASSDVHVLYPQFEMSPWIGLFLVTAIRQERFRYNFGRKWNRVRLEESAVMLPATRNGQPDWSFMEKYVRLLPLGTQVTSHGVSR